MIWGLCNRILMISICREWYIEKMSRIVMTYGKGSGKSILSLTCWERQCICSLASSFHKQVIYYLLWIFVNLGIVHVLCMMPFEWKNLLVEGDTSILALWGFYYILKLWGKCPLAMLDLPSLSRSLIPCFICIMAIAVVIRLTFLKLYFT